MVKIIGYITLAVSCTLFLLIPVVPLLDISKKQMATIAGILLVAGEILFYLSLIILGRSFYNKFKSKLKFWKTRKSDPESPSQKEQDL